MIKKSLPFFLHASFESVIAQHLTGKILSFDFYSKVVCFELRFGFHGPLIPTVQTDRFDLKGLALGKSDVIYSLAESPKISCVNVHCILKLLSL